MLILPGISCADVLASPCPPKEGVKTTYLNTNTHNEEDHSDDACTPFCSCACCQIATEVHFTLEKNNIAANSTIQYEDNYSARIPEMHYSIWQPPQL